MKAAKFDYQNPGQLSAALQALSAAEGVQGPIKVMGGSQSMGPMLNLRLTRPKKVVDVSHLPELRGVQVQNGNIRIGAAVTHAEIEDGVHEALRGSMLQYVAGGIAYRAVRNRGTIAGSLAHADPAADWVLTLSALAADIELRSASGTRTLAMDSFMLGAYTTEVQEGEIITAITVPQLDASARWGYYKFCRKTGEFAEASCACVFDPKRRRARIMVGALDGAPQPLPELARLVASTAKLPDRETIAAALAKLGDDPVKQQMQLAVVTRCLQQALMTPEVMIGEEEQPA
ncbi:FAD binding domain-containing protein [Bordetella avium]|uniref:FAD binding domain-containing protein n=1 Tax=Bordetella avium TaxID=521 RepID=UPI0002F65DC2|nr:carbon monoxide dehydrogenase [Bordetella avium]AZY52324.1 carbon monoxide dehydrogenase [Bordetella avium]RIQ14207.1 carbon monoxide dehydrogenase [Bordetella avium]RIQ18083.1 carbon monoxide dehydrogenase [Bordetella avium]RIQ36554.1 carbon monoxide dehydrogenase [Bordetella avium]